MKFLIQKIENQIQHDFSFTLLESVRFHDWLQNDTHSTIKYINCKYDDNGILQLPVFKKYHHTYIPIGSVEFVSQFLNTFYGLTPKPRNVPESLFSYAGRGIFNGNETNIPDKHVFVKSNDVIKGYSQVFQNGIETLDVSKGNYQISDYINIDSEWRTFVYKNKLVGLQHYVGEFTMFPDVRRIKEMIESFTDSPIAYTLDVGINNTETFVIEVHDFFSCGLYGFSDHSILPSMFSRWFHEYISKNN